VIFRFLIRQAPRRILIDTSNGYSPKQNVLNSSGRKHCVKTKFSSAQGRAVGAQEGDLLAGTYKLKKPIGRGAFGVVWLADDLPGSRPVCVKMVPPEVVADQAELARVRTMFQKVHALQHQHLCPLYALGEDPVHRTFLVMKYIDGMTLSEFRRLYVKQFGSFPLRRVISLLTPIALCLDYIHSQGIVHRDLKPANVLVSRDAKDIQIVDLGLAAEIRSSMSRVSRQMVG
jgi:eukaryotic-like serine/threonine-protein kinase